jgi:CRISPR/Cas system-associated exonuclease Cas4 (RecB family)
MDTVVENPTEQSGGLKLDHLSWSSIQTYRTCPRKFFYKYVARAPEESVAAALLHGGAIHRAVERAHEARMQGLPMPGVEELLCAYDEGWGDGVHGRKAIQYAKGEDAATLRELAGRMLSAYREHLASEAAAETIGIEHAARFRLLSDAPPVEARLDLVELRGADLVVTDLKTSRSRWTDDKAREQLPQLVFYAYAAAPILRDLGAARLVLRFVVVTKGKAPVVQVVAPKASSDDASRAKQLLADCWQTMRSSSAFVRHEGWQCKQCPFRVRCLGSR